MTSNVSKARRDALLKKIKEIRAFIEEAAAGDENAARLLEFADEIEKEARGKKYGLVFEGKLLTGNCQQLTELPTECILLLVAVYLFLLY